KTIVISADEVRRAIREPLGMIVDAVMSTLDKCPPELASDVMDNGIALAGGGALLHGMGDRLREETGLPVHLADHALEWVAPGAGKRVEALQPLRTPRPADAWR